MQQLRLRFFDVEAEILSDCADYIKLFALMYRRFLTQASSARQPPLRFILQTQPDNTWDKPMLNLHGEAWPVDDPRFLNSFFYDCVLNAIVAHVRSHFLIHAGVVTWAGQGIILAGDASHGKTTLVLELLRRGFKFLSDEMAALGRADRLVHPFPRSLRIEPDSLGLTGFPDAAHAAPVWIGKLLLDIEEIRPDSLGQAAPIRHIIILQDPAEANSVKRDDAEQELGVLVNRIDDALLDAVCGIAGVADVRPTVERGYPAVRLRALHRMSVLSEIEQICHEQRILILDVSKREEKHPTFQALPRLEAIPSSQTVLELLRRFQGGHKSTLLQEEFGGSATRLFFELAETIGQANCFQLFVGRLHQMADLVCELVRAPD